MTKKKLPVRFTGQHFTIDKVLIKDAIRQANISNQDTVLDIGAGKGFLTVHLLKIANNVVAIENDTALVEHLRKLFSDARNVQVVGCDFRNFAVPKFPFKVVSNIPYGITSDIFKILMFESLGNFLGGSIVLQLEPTQKLFSRKLYNPYTVFYHTFFDLKLVYEVGPESFFPPPTVKSALLNIKRKQLFFDFKFKAKYLAFISCLLEKPDLSVKTALKSIFRKSQVRSISEKFGLNLNAQIVCLSPSQWVNCFLEMLEVVPENFILRSSKSGGCQDDFSGLVSSFKLPHNIVLTAKSAVIFFKYITLRTNIKKVQYTTNSVPHFFRQIGQDLTFIA